MKNSLVFIGTSWFAVPILKKLHEEGVAVSLVITQPDRPAGRHQTLTPSPVKTLAEQLGLPVFQPEKLDQAAVSHIAAVNPEIIIVAAYGQLLPDALLALPSHGCLNIHPSLLPKYRGASPIQTAIFNGDTQTGVSIIVLDNNMDHGPIVAQRPVVILDDDTTESLGYGLAGESADLLLTILPDYLAGKLPAQLQDDHQATFTKQLTSADGHVDWQRTAGEIDCQIRAMHPWPGAWTISDGQRVKILKAHLLGGELMIDTVQPAGKPAMRYDDYRRGHPPLGTP